VKLRDLKHDCIGKRRGVGPGVVGNIKLNLGERVIKPDRHVTGVMKDFLQVDIPFDRYDEFAGSLGKRQDTWIAFYLSTGRQRKYLTNVRSNNSSFDLSE